MTLEPDTPVMIRLLGQFEVQRGERVLLAESWPRKKAASLLKRLALERRLLKDQAIEFLWPESDLDSSSNNLYKTLHVVRQTLNQALGEGTDEELFDYKDSVLKLSPNVWVDVREFERLYNHSTSLSPQLRKANIEMALQLYAGDLLPDDLYEQWTMMPRETLYQCQRNARLALAVHHRDSFDYASAIALLTPLLIHDRADEPVHRELMLIYALMGERHEALRQYQSCVEGLAEELDVQPAAETTDLHSQIIAGALVPLTPAARPLKVPAPRLSEKPRPLFVGRERELSTLQSHLAAAMKGDGRILFVTGEAGQGKTSLMSQFAYLASDENPHLVVATGLCHSLIGLADPYMPFRDIFSMLNGDWQRTWIGGAISSAQASRLHAVASQTAQVIARYAPDLADIMLPATHSEQRRYSQGLKSRQIFNQVWQLLRSLAVQQPLLLLLDDLQWIDPPSANLLFYLGRELVNVPILIVGAYRPSELIRIDSGTHPLTPVVNELVRYRGDILIDLEATLPAEERGFVDALLDSEPNSFDASFREALYKRTEGHPLFTIELLQALREREILVKDESGRWMVAASLDWRVLPNQVEAVIARRTEGLPAAMLQLLSAASVEGETFTVEVIAAVKSMDVQSVLRIFSELDQRYRLVREVGEWRSSGRALTRFQFRHNLFQQFFYNQLGSAERRVLHGEVAAALEQIDGEHAGQLAVSLAQHYTSAGLTDKAVYYLSKAGDDARMRLMLEEAVRFYQLALKNWSADDQTGQADVMHKLGESLLALGKAREAGEHFSAAERLYKIVGHRSGRGAMWRLIGRSFWEQGERTKALESYHQALSILEQEPKSPELARAVGAMAQMHMLADEYDQAIAWGERAVALGKELDIEDVMVHAMTSVGVARASTGEAERGLAMIAASQVKAEALNLPHDTCRAYAGWGDVLINLERFDEARTVYERMLAYAEKIHAGMFQGVALIQLAYLDWWGGHWRAAWKRGLAIQEWMEESTEISMAKVWASNFLGSMYNDLGLPEYARAILEIYSPIARSADELQTTVPHLCQLARCASMEAQQANLVQEMLVLIDQAAYLRYEILPALHLVSRWLLRSSGGDPSTLERVEKLHHRIPGRQSTAFLADIRGYAAGLRGEWEKSAVEYEAAAVQWEMMKRPQYTLHALAGKLQALSCSKHNRANLNVENTLAVVRSKAVLIYEQLADELDDPGVKQAFLASPLITEIQTGLYTNG